MGLEDAETFNLKRLMDVILQPFYARISELSLIPTMDNEVDFRLKIIVQQECQE
jgi:hypothetical protein